MVISDDVAFELETMQLFHTHTYGNGLFAATEIFVTMGRGVQKLGDPGLVRLWSTACGSRALVDQL